MLPWPLHSLSMSGSVVGVVVPLIFWTLNQGLSYRPEFCGAWCQKGINFPGIVQFGQARTATTTQYQAICAVAFAKGFAVGLDGCGWAGSCQKPEKNVKCPAGPVVKTHYMPTAELYLRERSFLLATTSDKKPHQCPEPPVTDTCKRLKLQQTAVVTQLLPSLVERGTEYICSQISEQYAPMFKLTPEQVSIVQEYIQIWMPLRRCCGFQSSHSYRALLREVGLDFRLPHPSDHFCVGVNTTELELQLLGSRLLKGVAEPPLQLLGLSAGLNTNFKHFGLTGTYCQRTEIMHRLGVSFNGHANDGGEIERLLGVKLRDTMDMSPQEIMALVERTGNFTIVWP